jgi:nitroreductase
MRSRTSSESIAATSLRCSGSSRDCGVPASAAEKGEKTDEKSAEKSDEISDEKRDAAKAEEKKAVPNGEETGGRGGARCSLGNRRREAAVLVSRGPAARPHAPRERVSLVLDHGAPGILAGLSRPTPSSMDPPPGSAPSSDWARTLIHSRQTVLPKRLVDPGPDTAQQRALFEAAAAAPDHEQRLPWRFVIVPREQRARLAEVFAQALLDRDAQATHEQVAAAREKAHRAPLLMLAIARLDEADTDVPAAERWVSLGCAIQNLLLCAHAMGFGAALTSGQALRSPRLRALFALAPGEQPACFVNVGTVSQRKPMRARPDPDRFVSTL